MKSERIKIYVWEDDNNILPTISNIRLHKDVYNPEDNARNVAKLIMLCFPGNTLDLILESIEKEILPMLESEEKINMLKSPYDIQNRIRIALNDMMIEKESVK